MKSICLGICLVAGAFAQQPGGTPVFTTFDAPGAGTVAPQGTFGVAINTSGVITGNYVDASNATNGFVRATDGTLTTFHAPGLGTGDGPMPNVTSPQAINAAAVVTGYFYHGGAGPHGFVRGPGGDTVTFDVPGVTAFNTSPRSINSAGAIAGSYLGAGVMYYSFVRSANGAIITFGVTGASGTYADSINDAGDVTGWFTDANGANHGFVRAPGGYITTFDAPGAGTSGAQGTFPDGINEAGEICGYYTDAQFKTDGFVRAPDGVITTFYPPDAQNPVFWPPVNVWGINNAGAVVGTYQDIATGLLRTFIRAANGAITTFEFPSVGTGPNQTGGIGINDAGAVTGSYQDASSLNHGFLLTY